MAALLGEYERERHYLQNRQKNSPNNRNYDVRNHQNGPNGNNAPVNNPPNNPNNYRNYNNNNYPRNNNQNYYTVYPINRATTNKVLNIVTQLYILELGVSKSIITDHGTQFRGRKWKETLMDLGVRTYKTSVYHPNSNPAGRVLRQVGRILRTYCHDQQRKWNDYINAKENFNNLAYHESIRDTSYTIMYGRRCV